MEASISQVRPTVSDQASASSAGELGVPWLDPRGLLSVTPIIVYVVVRQLSVAPVAIGAGLAVAVLVFALNRKQGGSVIQWMSVFGLVAITAGAIAGIALNSDKAFLANDVAGDFIMAAILAASAIIGRPIAGSITHELLPRVRGAVPKTHRVFVRITWLYVLSNLGMGAYRLYLLGEVSASEYVLYSRAVAWPLGVVMFGLVILLMSRVMRADAARAQTTATAVAPIDFAEARQLDAA